MLINKCAREEVFVALKAFTGDGRLGGLGNGLRRSAQAERDQNDKAEF